MILIKNRNKEMCFLTITEPFKLLWSTDKEFRTLCIQYLSVDTTKWKEELLVVEIWRYKPTYKLDRIATTINTNLFEYIETNKQFKGACDFKGVVLNKDKIKSLCDIYSDEIFIKEKLIDNENDMAYTWKDQLGKFEDLLIDKLTEEIAYSYNQFKEVDKYTVISNCKRKLLNSCADDFIENHILTELLEEHSNNTFN